MATVQSILSSVSTRINDDADLYAFINMAIRIIAKRLFQMGSSIVISPLEVPVYAEIEYTASTIAFEVTNPDTITDSANGFITEGFKAGMDITTDDITNPGPFRLSSVSAGALTVVGDSPVLSAVSAGTAITITSNGKYGELPDDFWGLIDKPYLDGDTDQLEPVPSQRVELAYSLSPGEPAYYKIRGTKLYLIPAPSSDEVVKGDYFAKPEEVTTKDALIPYNGFIDDIVTEAIVLFYADGGKNIGILRDFVNVQLDLIVSLMDLRGPTEFPRGIDWDDATN